MLHLLLVISSILFTFIITLIALSGIKFYTLNAGVENAESDAKKLKILTLIAFVISCATAITIIFI